MFLMLKKFQFSIEWIFTIVYRVYYISIQFFVIKRAKFLMTTNEQDRKNKWKTLITIEYLRQIFIFLKYYWCIQINIQYMYFTV